MISYEYPLNERIRTLLRLEDLFDKVMHFVRADGSLEHHVALVTLFEILEVASRADLKANALDPKPANVTVIQVPHGQSVTAEVVEKALAQHKPTWAVMAHWETGSGRINDLKGFSDACLKHNAMGLVDAVSSLGIEDFAIEGAYSQSVPGFARHGPVLAGELSPPDAGPALTRIKCIADVSFGGRAAVRPSAGSDRPR